MTDVYAADVSVLEAPALYEKAYALASLRRREKTDRYVRCSDKRLSLGAELLLRYALRERGLPDLTDAPAEGRFGKPYFPDGRISFSLSHSGEMALCAVADAETGCDIERIGEADIALARRFFAAEEYEAILREETETGRRCLFYRLWTLKESFLKASGRGMYLPLNAFSVCTQGKITVRQTAEDGDYHFAEFTALPGYACAVCTAGREGRAALHTVGLGELLLSVGPGSYGGKKTDTGGNERAGADFASREGRNG